MQLLTWRRFGRNKLAVVGLLIILSLYAAAVLAPMITSEDPMKVNTLVRLQPPSSEHLFGTDEYGRDVFARVTWGARVSLYTGVLAMGILVCIGVVVGAVAGYFGGRIDAVLMGFTDLMMSLPGFFLLLTVVALFGPGLYKTMVVIGLTSWMGTARLVRSEVLSLRSGEFVQAAHALGATSRRILRRHIVPNVLGSVIVQATLFVSYAILIESSLSYLGLGAQPPTPSWGNMLSGGRRFMRDAWWLMTFPGSAIFLTVLAFNILGDGLRDMLDPRLKDR